VDNPQEHPRQREARVTNERITDRQSPGAYAWAVVAMLWFVAMLNYLDRLMITSMRDPIRAEIHLTDGQFGLLTSVFLWVYAAMSPLGGFIADRAGRRGIIVASLFFWSMATCVSGWAATFNQMLLARALMGLSEACYIPAALALIADYHRGPTRSLATGLHMVGIYTGAALGGIGGFIAERFGWRFGFQVFGGIGMAYCVLLWLLLRDAPAGATTELEPDLPPANEPQYGIQPTSTFASAAAALFTRSGFWILLAINVLVGVVNWAIYGWMPTFLKGHFHLGLGQAGLSATAYIQIASFVGVLVAGVLADRWRQRNRKARAFTPAIGYLIAGPFLILAASTNLLGVAIGGLIVFGLGRGAFDANQMPLLREIVDERYSATGYGVLNLIGTMAGGIMVYVGGRLMDAQIDLALLFQGAGAALFVAGALLLAIRIPKSHATTESPRDQWDLGHAAPAHQRG
jgi:MFS family permease